MAVWGDWVRGGDLCTMRAPYGQEPLCLECEHRPEGKLARAARRLMQGWEGRERRPCHPLCPFQGHQEVMAW